MILVLWPSSDDGYLMTLTRQKYLDFVTARWMCLDMMKQERNEREQPRRRILFTSDALCSTLLTLQVLFFTCTSAWLGRKPFIHLSRKRMIWWVNKTTSLLRLQWECIRPDDLGNYNNIGHTGTYGSSETSETVILAGYSSRCDTDAAQMYLRRKVTDKWGAARGTPRCGIIRKMIHFHYKSRSSLPSVKSEG